MTCVVRKQDGRQRVICAVKKTGRVSSTQARARLMRAGEVYAWGTVASLRPIRKLERGRYVLRIGSGRDKAALRVALR